MRRAEPAASLTAARYAVFGQPIAHSLSPCIHAAFAAEFGIAIDYRPIEASQADFPSGLETFAQSGGHGANVTLPLKQDATGICATLGDAARRCGSVNTLTRTGAAWHGDSTDGLGFLHDLRERHAFDPQARCVLLLGAGGAARAIAFALLDAEVGELVIANRTLERAQALALATGQACVRACHLHDLDHSTDFDLIVNATSAGHTARPFELTASPVAPTTLCYDLSYAHAADPFLAWAHAAGAARAIDGLGMLVEQAAQAFALWHAVKPDTTSVYTQLRASLATSNA